MNWGGFAGGFSQGFNNGVRMGETYRKAKKEGEIQDIITKGSEEAAAKRRSEMESKITEGSAASTERQQEITQAVAADTPQVATPVAEDPMTADQVQTQPVATPQVSVRELGMPHAASPQGATPMTAAPATPAAASQQITPQAALPAAQPVPQLVPTAQQPAAPVAPVAAAGVPGRFMVGNQGFNTREEALAAAEKQVPSTADYVLNTITPKMQQFHIANGDIEKAEALGKYMESRRGQAAVKQFGLAMNKLLFTTDTAGGVEALGDYYSKYVDDGVDFKSHTIGEDGRINITLQHKGGKESQMALSKQEVLQLGMAHDPAKLFEMANKQAEESRKSSAELAKESRTAKREDQRDRRNHEQAIELKTIDSALKNSDASAKTRREVGAKVDMLKSAGYSDEFINEALPAIIGIGDYKKKTSPEEAKRLALSDRMKNDPTFSRKPREEQQKIIDEDMALVYGGLKPTATPAAAAGITTPNDAKPSGGAKPDASKPQGKPMMDTKTGKIVIR